MTQAQAKAPEDLVPPGHRYINDYYGHRVINGNPKDFVVLGQWKEYDLYAVKCMNQWSLGARWSDEGSEYMGCTYQWELDKFKRNGKYPQWEDLATNHAMERFTAYLETKDRGDKIRSVVEATVKRLEEFTNGAFTLGANQHFFNVMNSLESIPLRIISAKGFQYNINGWDSPLIDGVELNVASQLFVEQHFPLWSLDGVVVEKHFAEMEGLDYVKVSLLMITPDKHRREFSINFYHVLPHQAENDPISEFLTIIEFFKAEEFSTHSTCGISIW